MKFRKRPIVVEAFKIKFPCELTCENFPEWFLYRKYEECIVFVNSTGKPHFLIRTLEGDMRANDGDWIIRGINNEIYPCKADIFEKTYEPIEDAKDGYKKNIS